LNDPTNNTTIRTEIKIKNRRSHLELLLFPYPFSNQLFASALPRLAPPLPRCRDRCSCNAATCYTEPSVATYFPVSPPPLDTRRRVLRAITAWFTMTALAQRSSSCPAACLSPSFLSTAPKRRLLATILPHQVGLGCRRRQVCFKSCFQVFHLYVAYVAMTIYVCCKYIFQVFQLFHTYVSSISFVCFMCFICMFHLFHLDVVKGSDVAYVAMVTHLYFK
jgi:hypothetical protein